MIVDANQTEFGYELIACVPFAHWLHLNNMLTGVKSCKDTRCLYYFTENHEEIYSSRSEFKKPNVPNGNIHVPMLDLSRWSPPSFKDYYKNDKFVWDKPTLVICNKFKNGGRNPIGLSHEVLSELFSYFYDDYQIIYNRPLHKNITHDESPQVDIGDYDLIKNDFPEIIDINKLYVEYSNLTCNMLQVMIMANCENFISMQGGSSIFCSYFGGTNLIYAYEGSELGCGSYHNWYNKLSGAKIYHSSTIDDLKRDSLRLFGKHS
ncbi:MAG: hypothetical protein CMB80_08935 [Flammeovirgaceae bacterium]|nr:hypothetical protein [Flammeovirgaceae bacterium]|tara:strand:- start:510 stop:1298 length:789 start_codon:yes stop_codon:yes gene_type:complete